MQRFKFHQHYYVLLRKNIFVDRKGSSTQNKIFINFIYLFLSKTLFRYFQGVILFAPGIK